jgi:hypothetical protein
MSQLIVESWVGWIKRERVSTSCRFIGGNATLFPPYISVSHAWIFMPFPKCDALRRELSWTHYRY